MKHLLLGVLLLASAQVLAQIQSLPAIEQAVKAHLMGTEAAHAEPREADEQALGERVRSSDDFREGVAAFLEKRTPRYR